MNDSDTPIVVAALYHFARLDALTELQASLQDTMASNGVRGTVLLAEEGINGTIAGPRAGVDRVLSFLRSDLRLQALKHKESFADSPPFRRTRVRLKKEIVTLGVDGVDPTVRVGRYVSPDQWNQLISDPDVTVIDTRNRYEVRVGSFEGAQDPETSSFRDFPEFVENHLDPDRNRRVAMFCTGGIRCEKATSYLLGKGFDEVYHLEGGILKYLEDVPEEESLWRGECFVFDDRVTVDHGLHPGSYDMCHACRTPLSESEVQDTRYEPGISCPHCFESRSVEDRARFAERQLQMRLAKERGTVHLGS